MCNAVVTLKKGEGRILKSGGMWVFDNEIAKMEGNFENGDMITVHDFDGYPMGQGFKFQDPRKTDDPGCVQGDRPGFSV